MRQVITRGEKRFTEHEEPRLSSIAFVSTYPPTKCGIATFTTSLLQAIVEANGAGRFGVLRSVDGSGGRARQPEVIGELLRGSPASLEAGAQALNHFGLVVVQHEFGIYGGKDGAEIVSLVQRVRVPVIVVLHTVPADPSPHQQAIVQELAASVDRVVCQSRVARDRLLASHSVQAGRLRVIPHGAPPNLGSALRLVDDGPRRPTILTWGLLGPGKGIEAAIDAMGLLRHLRPRPRYVVLGETHPRIVTDSGHAYRESLIAQAAVLGIEDMVEFVDGYHDAETIQARIRDADLVLLPYLSREQVVSGVLVEAIASGKPVVSTSFPFAVEMLSQGSGITVPHGNARLMADAVHSLITDPGRAASARAAAISQAPTVFWSTVAEAYIALAAELLPHTRAVGVEPTWTDDAQSS